MTRLIPIAALAATLLLWTAQTSSAQSDEYSEEMVAVTDPSCSNPQCRSCQTRGHRHGVGVHHGGGHHGIGIPAIGLPIIGLPCPEFLHGGFLQGGMLQGGMLQGGVLQGREDGTEPAYVQRLGGTEPVRQCPIKRATVPIPVGPPPSSFVGGFFQPQQYQQMSPMAAGFPGYAQQQGGYPQVQVQQQGGYPQAQQGYGGQAQGGGYAQGYYAPPVEQRIVYVPYAAPPAIHVHMQRGGMGMNQRAPLPPVMRVPLVKRMLGDTSMYEYPEMPLQLYTTRGPRDFFAPNPPSIGE